MLFVLLKLCPRILPLLLFRLLLRKFDDPAEFSVCKIDAELSCLSKSDAKEDDDPNVADDLRTLPAVADTLLLAALGGLSEKDIGL